ncbi:MAG: twin-arginine translocase TatA/TatE family subunit [Bacteroidota bacterium]
MILLGIFGGQEIILVIIAILILFGGKKIPELMHGIGKGINEFNKAKDGVYNGKDNQSSNAEKEKREMNEMFKPDLKNQ